jgi:hypothetical protein
MDEAAGVGEVTVVTERKFTDRKLAALHALIQGDVVRDKPDSGWIKEYDVDMDRTIAILTPFVAQQVQPNLEAVDFDESDTQTAFRKTVKAFVDRKVITSQLAEKVGRLVRPSNVTVHGESYFRFLYMEDKFPKKTEERGKIEFSRQGFPRLWAKLEVILGEANISLSSD